MGKVYTKDELLTKVKEGLKPETVSEFYKQDYINYTGNIPDSREKYTEVIAECLLGNHSALKKIEMITREGSYNTRHDWKPFDPVSPRTEEQIARSMLGKVYDYIGKIIDYQTPLKNVQGDVAGKIDLLSWNEAQGCAYILELKVQNSAETLLRCVLEIETYSRIVDSKKILSDFGHEGSTLRKAVLVYQNDNSRPHLDFISDRNVKELMNTLGVDLFVLDERGEKIIAAHYYEKLEV